MKRRERIAYIDAGRAMACCLVVLNHAASAAIPADSSPDALTLKAVCFIVGKLGVPLFLMLSGALLLRREFCNREDIFSFYRTNLLPLLLTSECWYFLHFWFLQFADSGSLLRTSGLPAAVAGCIKTALFIDQTAFPGMWFLPIILCIYLTVPFLSMAVHRYTAASARKILPLLWAVLSFLPWTVQASILRFEKFPEFIQLLQGYYYPVYCLAGFFLSTAETNTHRRPALCFLILLICAVSFQATLWISGCDYSIDYFDPVLLPSAFLLLQLLKVHVREAGPSVMLLSRYSFGIYMLHMPFLMLLKQSSLSEHFSAMQLLPLYFLSSLLLSLLLSYLISHLKSAGRLLIRIKA